MIFLSITCLVLICLYISIVYGNPQSGVVVAGQVSIAGDMIDQLVVIQNSQSDVQQDIIDWKKFNIAVRQHNYFQYTYIQQPNKDAIILNQVDNNYISRIDDKLTANDNVITGNPNSIIVGANSIVEIDGLIVNTNHISNQVFINERNGGKFHFDLSGSPTGVIANKGNINVRGVGIIGFVDPHVANSDTINAKISKLILSSDERFAFDMYKDKLIRLNLTKQVKQQSIAMGRKTNDPGVRKTNDPGDTIFISSGKTSNIDSNIIDVGEEIKATVRHEKNGIIYLFINNKKELNGKSSAKLYDKTKLTGGLDGRNVIIAAQNMELNDNAVIHLSYG